MKKINVFIIRKGLPGINVWGTNCTLPCIKKRHRHYDRIPLSIIKDELMWVFLSQK